MRARGCSSGGRSDPARHKNKVVDPEPPGKVETRGAPRAGREMVRQTTRHSCKRETHKGVALRAGIDGRTPSLDPQPIEKTKLGATDRSRSQDRRQTNQRHAAEGVNRTEVEKV